MLKIRRPDQEGGSHEKVLQLPFKQLQSVQRRAFEAAGAQRVDNGAAAGLIEESVVAMGDMPGACVALQQDSRRERNGEA